MAEGADLLIYGCDLASGESGQALVESFQAAMSRIRREVGKVIVGQDEVVEDLLITLLVGGHCLITGLPGTLIPRALNVFPDTWNS